MDIKRIEKAINELKEIGRLPQDFEITEINPNITGDLAVFGKGQGNHFAWTERGEAFISSGGTSKAVMIDEEMNTRLVDVLNFIEAPASLYITNL